MNNQWRDQEQPLVQCMEDHLDDLMHVSKVLFHIHCLFDLEQQGKGQWNRNGRYIEHLQYNQYFGFQECQPKDPVDLYDDIYLHLQHQEQIPQFSTIELQEEYHSFVNYEFSGRNL